MIPTSLKQTLQDWTRGLHTIAVMHPSEHMVIAVAKEGTLHHLGYHVIIFARVGDSAWEASCDVASTSADRAFAVVAKRVTPVSAAAESVEGTENITPWALKPYVTIGEALSTEERAQLFACASNLSSAEAALMATEWDMSLDALRNSGHIYSVRLDYTSTGVKYPAWQFSAAQERLRPILAILFTAELESWAIHQFLTSSQPFLNGKSPSEAIVDTSFPMRKMVQCVHARVARR